MGDADVPVGQYTQRILAHLGLDETVLARNGRIAYGSNVKEGATQVSEGLADRGIIYRTDAVSSQLTVVDEATEEMCGRVICPASCQVLEGAGYVVIDFRMVPDGPAPIEDVLRVEVTDDVVLVLIDGRYGVLSP